MVWNRSGRGRVQLGRASVNAVTDEPIINEPIAGGNARRFSVIIPVRCESRIHSQIKTLDTFTAEKHMKRHAITGMAVVASAMLAGSALAQTPAGDPAAGAKKNSMCVGCHGIAGYKTAFPEVYSVPKIGGQHPAYIVKALQAYKNGERKHPSMVGIASSLSDKDMADLAAYYAAGPGKVASK